MEVHDESLTDAAEQADMSSGFERLITYMDDVAHELGLTARRRRTGWTYDPTEPERGVRYPSGVGVYASGRGAEFNLSVFREVGDDAVADDLLRRIREVAGANVGGQLWPAVPCESLTRDWARTRTEVIEPYFAARARLRDRLGSV